MRKKVTRHGIPIGAVLIVVALVGLVVAGGWYVVSNELTKQVSVGPRLPHDDQGNAVPFILQWRDAPPPNYPQPKNPRTGEISPNLLSSDRYEAEKYYYVQISANLFNSDDVDPAQWNGPVRVMVSVDSVTTATYGGWTSVVYNTKDGAAGLQFEDTYDRSEEGVLKMHQIAYFWNTSLTYPTPDHTWDVDYTNALTHQWTAECWFYFGSSGTYDIKVWCEGMDGSMVSNAVSITA